MTSPTDNPDGSEIELLQLAIDQCIAENKQYVESWRAVDTKALAVLTISGIFMGAVFAMVNGLHDSTHWLVRLWTSAIPIVLVLACFLAAMAQRIAVIQTMPDGAGAAKYVYAILAGRAGAVDGAWVNLHHELLSDWCRGNATISTALERKRKWVGSAQFVLFAAIALFGVLIVLTLG